MSQSLTQLKQYLYRVKPWVAVALLVAVVIVGYYSILGFRYWNASGEVDSLNSEIRTLTPKIRNLSTRMEAFEGEEALLGTLLDTVPSRFSYIEPHNLVGILSATARESAVDLLRVSVGNGHPETEGDVEFWIQPMDTTLSGNIFDLYRFLTLLQQKVPGTQVSSVSISGFDLVSSIRAEFNFYLLPKDVAEE